jgi:hypothetical protein
MRVAFMRYENESCNAVDWLFRQKTDYPAQLMMRINKECIKPSKSTPAWGAHNYLGEAFANQCSQDANAELWLHAFNDIWILERQATQLRVPISFMGLQAKWHKKTRWVLSSRLLR